MGFKDYSSYMEELTINETGQDRDFQKTPITAGALAAGGYYDLFEGGTEPAANIIATGSNAFIPVSNITSHNTMKFTNAVAGKSKHLVYGEVGGDVASSTGNLLIYDLLGMNADFSLAANTTYNTGDLGTKITRYTTNSNVSIGIIAQTVFSGTLPTVVINYTSSNGSGRATAAQTLIAGAVRGRYGINSWRVPLQAGDTDVLSIQSVVTAAGVGAGGKIAIFFMKVLGKIKVDTAQQMAQRSFINPQQAPLWPKVRNGAAINFAWQATGAANTPVFRGSINTVDGTDPV